MPWAPLNRLHCRRATPRNSFRISKRTLSRLIRSKKIAARKEGLRTLVDVASLKAYYESLPLKTDHAPLVFGERAHVRQRPHCKH